MKSTDRCPFYFYRLPKKRFNKGASIIDFMVSELFVSDTFPGQCLKYSLPRTFGF